MATVRSNDVEIKSIPSGARSPKQLDDAGTFAAIPNPPSEEVVWPGEGVKRPKDIGDIELSRQAVETSSVSPQLDQSKESKKEVKLSLKQKAFDEFYSTEGTFSEDMQTLMRVFKEIQEDPEFSGQNSEEFKQLQHFLEPYQAFVQPLYRRSPDQTTPGSLQEIELVSQALEASLKTGENQQSLQKAFVAFSQCVSQYNALLDFLKAHEKSRVVEFLDQKLKAVKGLQLKSYLIMPIQRVPRYPLTLTELEKDWHPFGLNQLFKQVAGTINGKDNDLFQLLVTETDQLAMRLSSSSGLSIREDQAWQLRLHAYQIATKDIHLQDLTKTSAHIAAQLTKIFKKQVTEDQVRKFKLEVYLSKIDNPHLKTWLGQYADFHAEGGTEKWIQKVNAAAQRADSSELSPLLKKLTVDYQGNKLPVSPAEVTQVVDDIRLAEEIRRLQATFQSDNRNLAQKVRELRQFNGGGKMQAVQGVTPQMLKDANVAFANSPQGMVEARVETITAQIQRLESPPVSAKTLARIQHLRSYQQTIRNVLAQCEGEYKAVAASAERNLLSHVNSGFLRELVSQPRYRHLLTVTDDNVTKLNALSHIVPSKEKCQRELVSLGMNGTEAKVLASNIKNGLLLEKIQHPILRQIIQDQTKLQPFKAKSGHFERRSIQQNGHVQMEGETQAGIRELQEYLARPDATAEGLERFLKDHFTPRIIVNKQDERIQAVLLDTAGAAFGIAKKSAEGLIAFIATERGRTWLTNNHLKELRGIPNPISEHILNWKKPNEQTLMLGILFKLVRKGRGNDLEEIGEAVLSRQPFRVENALRDGKGQVRLDPHLSEIRSDINQLENINKPGWFMRMIYRIRDWFHGEKPALAQTVTMLNSLGGRGAVPAQPETQENLTSSGRSFTVYPPGNATLSGSVSPQATSEKQACEDGKEVAKEMAPPPLLSSRQPKFKNSGSHTMR